MPVALNSLYVQKTLKFFYLICIPPLNFRLIKTNWLFNIPVWCLIDILKLPCPRINSKFPIPLCKIYLPWRRYFIPSQLMAISPNFFRCLGQNPWSQIMVIVPFKALLIASHLNWQKSWKPMQTDTITHQPPSWQFLLYPHFLLILSPLSSPLLTKPSTLASLLCTQKQPRASFLTLSIPYTVLPVWSTLLQLNPQSLTQAHQIFTQTSHSSKSFSEHIELCLHFHFISLQNGKHHLKL